MTKYHPNRGVANGGQGGQTAPRTPKIGKGKKFIRDIEGVPVCKLPPTFTETFRPRPKLKNIADLYEMLINIMFHRYLNISNGMNFA